MTSDNSGMLYIADTNGAQIRTYNTLTNYVGTLAGSGSIGYIDDVGTLAELSRPRGLTNDGTSIYWAEQDQHTVRQAVLATTRVTTLVGAHCGGAIGCAGGYAEGTGTAALFDTPYDVHWHWPSNTLFVVDSNNYVIRHIH